MGNQAVLPQQTTTAAAKVNTTNTNDVTGTVQPLPDFDETANKIVASTLATVHKKPVNFRIANFTDITYTIKNHNKLAELQVLRPQDTKQMQPLYAATLKLLEDRDDTHMYVN